MMTTHVPKSQLGAEELQQLRWLLGGVLALLSLSTVFTMEVGASILALVTLVAVAAATVWPAWLVLIPRWVHRLAFSFVAAFFTADLWLTGELLPAIVRLDVLLLFYRAITYRKKRDDLQVIVLGLFLIVLGGVLSVSLVFAVQILAFTGIALAFLLSITLTETSGGTNPSPRSAGASSHGSSAEAQSPFAARGPRELPGWARHIRWRQLLTRVGQVTNWRVVALGVALFAGLVGLSAVLFLAIPRFQLENSFFLERFLTKKTRTGFSDTIRIGEVTEITQDNSVALSVDVSDRREVPAAPYWRMLVLDEYRDGTFRLSPGMRRLALRQERGGVNLPGTAASRGTPPVFWTFYLEAGISRYLPLLGRFEALRFREPQNYRFSQSLGVLELRSEPATMLAYRVEGMENNAVVRDEVFATHWREHGTSRWSAGALLLQRAVTPADQARLREIVEEIAGGTVVGPPSVGAPAESTESGDGGVAAPAGDFGRTRRPGVQDEAAINVPEYLRRAEAWLGQRHAYTLSPRIPAGPEDPLVRWMTSTEAGHCELFAGSLVLLARTAGLPARVVTGFRGGSWNGYSNNFTLRNSDAHAWCEVFDAAAGTWLRSDPTPGSAAAARDEDRGEAGLAGRLDRSWTARLDSLRVFWYRRVVNFDQQSQLATLAAAKAATQRTGRQLREALERWAQGAREWLTAPWDARRVLTAAAVVALTVGLIWLGRRTRWGVVLAGLAAVIGLRFRTRTRIELVRREAGRWLRQLRARALQDEAQSELTHALERLRFGAPETWPEPARVFRQARRVCREGRGRRSGTVSGR